MISQKYFQIYLAVHVHFKTDKVDLKKTHCDNFFFAFFQSPHQVDMKNVVKWQKDFFCLFQCSRNIGCLVTQKNKYLGYQPMKILLFLLLECTKGQSMKVQSGNQKIIRTFLLAYSWMLWSHLNNSCKNQAM